MNVVLIWMQLALLTAIAEARCKYGGVAECLEPQDEPGCYLRKNTSRLEYDPIDDEYSSYNVFLLTTKSLCGFTSFDVTVHRMSVSEESSCNPDSKPDDQMLHRFKIDGSPITNCSEIKISFCVVYWTHGCYMISVKPAIDNNSHRPVNHYVWLANNYTNEDFKTTDPIFTYSNTQEHLLTNWVFDNKTFNDDIQPMYTVNLVTKNNGAFTTRKFSNCSINKNTVECAIPNVPQGNYTIYFQIFDEWKCRVSKKMYGSCLWTAAIERILSPNVSQYMSATPLHSYEWYGGILTAMTVFLLCATSLVSWIFYKKRISRRKWAQNLDHHLYTNGECQIRDKEKVKGIFLLYARDCQPFMDVMSKFRTYLSAVTGCKVYDIFDESQFNEIGMSPYEWVQYLIENPEIKVVVVATECADILYKNLMKHFRYPLSSHENNLQFYIIPNCLDNIVIHSLKLIAFDTTPPYHKYFVIRFPKFNKKGDYLSHVSPHKRFDLPDCLELLVENIMEQTQNKDEWDDSLNAIQSQSFIANKEDMLGEIKLLYDYFKTNPSYISKDLLKLEIIHTC